MSKFNIIVASGKQFIVKDGDEIFIDRLNSKKADSVEFETLATFDADKNVIKIGKPYITNKTKGKVIENLKGDKIQILKFKSKVRYTKRKGFRPFLSKVKISIT